MLRCGIEIMDFYLFGWALVFGCGFTTVQRLVGLLRRTTRESFEGLEVWVRYQLLTRFGFCLVYELIIFMCSWYFIEPEPIFAGTDIVIIGKLAKSDWTCKWTLFILFFTQSGHAITA